MMALASLPGLNESKIRSNMILLALFPGLPSFLFIRFALTVVYRRQVGKNRESLEAFIT